jgi:hypothetical protein
MIEERENSHKISLLLFCLVGSIKISLNISKTFGGSDNAD